MLFPSWEGNPEAFEERKRLREDRRPPRHPCATTVRVYGGYHVHVEPSTEDVYQPHVLRLAKGFTPTDALATLLGRAPQKLVEVYLRARLGEYDEVLAVLPDAVENAIARGMSPQCFLPKESMKRYLRAQGKICPTARRLVRILAIQ